MEVFILQSNDIEFQNTTTIEGVFKSEKSARDYIKLYAKENEWNSCEDDQDYTIESYDIQD